MAVEPGATIAVVGASARAAAFSLLRAGYKVVAADLFADADLAQHCPTTRIVSYPEGFAPWLAETECDAWMYTGALENYSELVDRLSSLRPLMGHQGDVLRRVRDPLQLQSVLNQFELSFPTTVAGGGSRSSDNNLIGKSYCGSGGSGVGTCAGANYLQRKVRGMQLSALFRGSQLLGVTRQLVGEHWAGASKYKYCGSIGPWELTADCAHQVQHLGNVLNAKFDLTELFGVDLILQRNRVWTIEVNPRYTAAVEIVERAHGITVFNEHGTQTPSTPVGKAVLFAKAPLVVDAAMSARLREQSGKMPWPLLADIPMPGTEISLGQPILTLFASASSCEAVQRRLQQRVNKIEQLLYGENSTCA